LLFIFILWQESARSSSELASYKPRPCKKLHIPMRVNRFLCLILKLSREKIDCPTKTIVTDFEQKPRVVYYENNYIGDVFI
jgi:hypothetical protein